VNHGNSRPITTVVFVQKTLLIFMPTTNSPGLAPSLTVSLATKTLVCKLAYLALPPRNDGTHTEKHKVIARISVCQSSQIYLPEYIAPYGTSRPDVVFVTIMEFTSALGNRMPVACIWKGVSPSSGTTRALKSERTTEPEASMVG
jgi:hypothetical protein